MVIVVLAVPSAIHSLGHRSAAAFPAAGAGAFAALVIVALTVIVPAKTRDGSRLPSDGEADVIIAGALLFLLLLTWLCCCWCHRKERTSATKKSNRAMF